MNTKIELLRDKMNCCGCEACVNACPKEALHMQMDEYGFLYPMKNNEMCINCNLCERVCNFKKENVVGHEEKKGYAVVSKDSEQRQASASGGFFAKLAENIIRQGGYVVGAAMSYDNQVEVKHIIVDSLKDLKRIQGSKYVQSRIGDIYSKVLGLLKEDKLVLFSGTPCQVDGLKGFLRKDYDNLITVDIICHGVPNNKIFSDYLKYKYRDGNVKFFSFRDRYMGWGMTGCVEIEKAGVKKKFYFTPNNSSYFSYFLKGKLYRENCYSCPYTGIQRPGDITIGDYWGIAEEHPDFKNKVDDAISAIITNTVKGKNYIELILDDLCVTESSFERIAKHNSQLRKPTEYPKDREILLDMYRDNGYSALENEYKKEVGALKIFRENIKLNLKSIRNRLR